MDISDARSLAAGIVPSGKGRGLEIDRVAQDLISNPWLKTAPVVELQINIQSEGLTHTIYKTVALPRESMEIYVEQFLDSLEYCARDYAAKGGGI